MDEWLQPFVLRGVAAFLSFVVFKEKKYLWLCVPWEKYVGSYPDLVMQWFTASAAAPCVALFVAGVHLAAVAKTPVFISFAGQQVHVTSLCADAGLLLTWVLLAWVFAQYVPRPVQKKCFTQTVWVMLGINVMRVAVSTVCAYSLWNHRLAWEWVHGFLGYVFFAGGYFWVFRMVCKARATC